MDVIIKKLKKILLRENNFEWDIPIESFIEIKTQKNGNSIAFIDGGSAEIFGNQSFSFGILRTAYVIFVNDIKKIGIVEYYFLVNSKEKNNGICYNAEIFAKNKKIFGKNFFEYTEDIDEIPGLLRRLAEIKTAEYVLNNFNVDFIIFDGNLESQNWREEEFLDVLFNFKTSIIAALSKTSRVFMKNGLLHSSVLRNNAPQFRWYYKMPNVDNKKNSNIYFTKLHKNSKHIFKVEINNKSLNENKKENNADNLFFCLAENSKDPAFIGYPYGLIEADRLARIPNNELLYMKNLFTAKLGKIDVAMYLSNSNAHEILDSISY